MDEKQLLERITVNPAIFGGKPIVRGRRLAVEDVLGMLAAGDSTETILAGYPWLEVEDIQACLAYAHKLVSHERIEPLVTTVVKGRSSLTHASGEVRRRRWRKLATTSSGLAIGRAIPATMRFCGWCTVMAACS